MSEAGHDEQPQQTPALLALQRMNVQQLCTQKALAPPWAVYCQGFELLMNAGKAWSVLECGAAEAWVRLSLSECSNPFNIAVNMFSIFIWIKKYATCCNDLILTFLFLPVYGVNIILYFPQRMEGKKLSIQETDVSTLNFSHS